MATLSCETLPESLFMVYHKAMTRNTLTAYVDYLQSFPRFSAKEYLALERIEYLLKLLGNPEKKMTGIQIAGTNGKGSVAATLDAVLNQAGYHVLTFTSPHLVSPVERFRLDGTSISEKKLVELVAAIKPFVAKTERALKDRPTWFEVMVAMAVLLAKRNKVDLLVCEVGLGGRLDATTALHLPVKVITSISYDHTEILGKSLAAIAREKAGIIHHAKDRVVTANTGTALRVIRERCLSVDAQLIAVRDGKDFAWKGTRWNGTTFALKNVHGTFRTSLIGHHQAENTALAIRALQVLADLGFPTAQNDIRKGVRMVTWPGRMQRFSYRGTTVLLDGAHNISAARALAQTIKELRLNKKQLSVIIGMKQTKDVRHTIPVLASLGKTVYFPRLNEIEHMSRPEDLYTIWSKGIIVDSWHDALTLAKSSGTKHVIITGSLYFIGDVLAELHKCTALPSRRTFRGAKSRTRFAERTNAGATAQNKRAQHTFRDDTFRITKRHHGRSR